MIPHFFVLALVAINFSLFAWGAIRFFIPKGRPEKGLILLVSTSVIAGAASLAAIFLTPQLDDGRAAIASVLLVFSLALYLACIRVNQQRRLSLAYSSDLPDHLVARGPYRWVRHPFYLSYLMAYFAAFLAVDERYALICLLLLSAVYFQAARFEERKFLASGLADRYRDYQARTGMFLPRLRKPY